MGVLLDGKWLKLPTAIDVTINKEQHLVTLAETIKGNKLIYLALDAKHSKIYETKGDELKPVAPEREQEIYSDFAFIIEKGGYGDGNYEELARLAKFNPTLLDSLPGAVAKQVRLLLSSK